MASWASTAWSRCSRWGRRRATTTPWPSAPRRSAAARTSWPSWRRAPSPAQCSTPATSTLPVRWRCGLARPRGRPRAHSRPLRCRGRTRRAGLGSQCGDHPGTLPLAHLSSRSPHSPPSSQEELKSALELTAAPRVRFAVADVQDAHFPREVSLLRSRRVRAQPSLPMTAAPSRPPRTPPPAGAGCGLRLPPHRRNRRVPGRERGHLRPLLGPGPLRRAGLPPCRRRRRQGRRRWRPRDARRQGGGCPARGGWRGRGGARGLDCSVRVRCVRTRPEGQRRPGHNAGDGPACLQRRAPRGARPAEPRRHPGVLRRPPHALPL